MKTSNEMKLDIQKIFSEEDKSDSLLSYLLESIKFLKFTEVKTFMYKFQGALCEVIKENNLTDITDTYPYEILSEIAYRDGVLKLVSTESGIDLKKYHDMSHSELAQLGIGIIRESQSLKI